jgi:four helix bundle suffix protein
LYRSYTTDRTFKAYVEASPPETAANTLICLVHQANFLLDRQLKQLEAVFTQEGGISERLYRARLSRRDAGDVGGGSRRL